MQDTKEFEALLERIRLCNICDTHLPLGPKPVLEASIQSRIAIIGQAPGTKVHKSGIPWNDASGKELRRWLDVDDRTFYDTSNFAIIPMGFCYPGKGKSGDLPPRPECALTWHEAIFNHLKNIELTLLIGQYAQRYYLQKNRQNNLTETVLKYHKYQPQYFPLPHPSPRNRLWMKNNPWFELDVVPVLRERVKAILVA